MLLHLEHLEVTNYGGPRKHDPRFLRVLLYMCPNLKTFILNDSIPNMQDNIHRVKNPLKSLILLPSGLRCQVRHGALGIQDFLS